MSNAAELQDCYEGRYFRISGANTMDTRRYRDGMATTNPELIRLQNENMRLRLLKAFREREDHEASEIRRLQRENDELRRRLR